jgi:dihydroorotate dehydrogenase
MSWLYKRLARPILFTQNPEQIHNRTMHLLGWAGRHAPVRGLLKTLFSSPELPVDILGLRFPNPVGLAAGMDKHAEALPIWAALGFGFTELGAVTWHAQPGNPSPRVFRAIPEEAIINRMGFNNPGAEAVAHSLERWRARGQWPAHPVGMNLGKSKITPLDKAPEDYANSLRVLLPYLDFFVVNVSSPNTPNLRQLQDKAALDGIFRALQEVQSQRSQPRKPILVKVAPDLSFEALDEILELVGPREIAGIIATNTTISRPPSSDPATQRTYGETGGLSGRPLRARSTEVIRHLHQQTKGTVPLIGVGGIFDATDAWEKIAAGASLVQIYTSMVYEGPGVARAIVHGLRERLVKEGRNNLSEVVGKGLSPS